MVVRILLLVFLISLVRSDEVDDLVELVLQSNNTITITATTDSKQPRNADNKNPPPEEGFDANGDPCTCVPYYLCMNGTILTDGTGVINIRMGTTECKEFMESCCKNPTDTVILPKPVERKGCGQRHPNGVGFKITGHNDSEAEFGEFPWMVALLKSSDDIRNLTRYRCGGALIHENVVLTAAHCISDLNEDGEMIVRAGEWDTQRTNEIFPHQDRKVIRTIIHPQFNGGNLWNDFGLLIVDKPFDFAQNVDTVCLPPIGVVPSSRECYVSGWGKDQFGKKGQYQVILKKIDLPMVPKDRCVTQLRGTRLGYFFRLHESFVCAGGVVGKDACKGDGGSPLVCPVEGKPGTYEVTGLVAWGIGCGSETPGVYAGVAYARPWIDKTMREYGFPLE